MRKKWCRCSIPMGLVKRNPSNEHGVANNPTLYRQRIVEEDARMFMGVRARRSEKGYSHLRRGRERQAHRPGEDLQFRAIRSEASRERELVALDSTQVKNAVARVNRSLSSTAWHVWEGRSNPPGPKGMPLTQLSYQGFRSVYGSEDLHSYNGPKRACVALMGTVHDAPLDAPWESD
jgi:hypothetical protein